MARTSEDGDRSDDELFAELEKDIDEDPDMAALRERRLEQLKEEFNQVKDMRSNEHGKLTEMKDEKEVIRISASEHLCVIHFYHGDFKRCHIMNQHLESLARKYFGTRFLKVNVESVPWLVNRLGIQVLPCVICFVDGVAKDRLIGFEEIGNKDDFSTGALELRLQMCDVIQKPKLRALLPSTSTSSQKADRKIRSGVASDSDSD